MVKYYPFISKTRYDVNVPEFIPRLLQLRVVFDSVYLFKIDLHNRFIK